MISGSEGGKKEMMMMTLNKNFENNCNFYVPTIKTIECHVVYKVIWLHQLCMTEKFIISMMYKYILSLIK